MTIWRSARSKKMFPEEVLKKSKAKKKKTKKKSKTKRPKYKLRKVKKIKRPKKAKKMFNGLILGAKPRKRKRPRYDIL